MARSLASWHVEGYGKLDEDPELGNGNGHGTQGPTAEGVHGYSHYKRLLADYTRRIDEYIEENAAEAVAEDSWRKKLGRDLANWSRRSDERMARLAESGRAASASRLSVMEAKVDALAAKMERVADLVQERSPLPAPAGASSPPPSRRAL